MIVNRVKLLTLCVFSSCSILTLAACSLAPDLQKPQTTLPDNWQLSAPTATEQNQEWWRVYQDDKLNDLVAETLTYNSDIQLAAARVDEARAIAGLSRANRMPNLTAAGGVSRGDVNLQDLPIDTKASDSFSLGGLLSYEIDIWGRLANADKAAKQQLLAQQANQRAVTLGITAETVANYFAISALNDQIATTKKTIKTRKDAYDLQSKRLKAGDIDALVVRQSEAQLVTAKARLPMLEQLREQRLSALSVLLGKTPKEIMESAPFKDSNKATLPSLPALPHKDVADVITLRPDIIAAEHTLTAANANIGVARAAYLPSISVGGLLATSSGEFDSLFQSDARSWGLGANAVGPLMDFGRARAQVDRAKAKEKQAYINYEKTVRVAFREIKDALTAREKIQEQLTEQEKQVSVLRETTRLARKRFDAGYSSYMDVLDAERSLFDSEISLIDTQRQLLQSSVDLYRALGSE